MTNLPLLECHPQDKLYNCSPNTNKAPRMKKLLCLCTPNEFNFNIHSPISSVLGFHQLLRRISSYLAAKCSTVFTSLLLILSV